MESTVMLSILANVATTADFTLRNLSIGSKKLRGNIVADAGSSLFRVFEEEADPLVGIWELAKWSYVSEAHKFPHVNGVLAVQWRYPGERRWRATMLLQYMEEGVRFTPWDRLRGRYFETGYDVMLVEHGVNQFTANTKQIYRRPDRGPRASGRFDLGISPNGELSGSYENLNSTGTASVIFSMRKRWREIAGT